MRKLIITQRFDVMSKEEIENIMLILGYNKRQCREITKKLLAIGSHSPSGRCVDIRLEDN
jgi:hypothetical protein